jgi:hypothetical protein
MKQQISYDEIFSHLNLPMVAVECGSSVESSIGVQAALLISIVKANGASHADAVTLVSHTAFFQAISRLILRDMDDGKVPDKAEFIATMDRYFDKIKAAAKTVVDSESLDRRKK